MPTIIEVPGRGEIEFPDSMSDADITAAVKRLAGGTSEPARGSALSEFGSGLVDQGKDMFGGLVDAVKSIPTVVSRAVGGEGPEVAAATKSGFGEGAAQGLKSIPQMVTDPIALATGATPVDASESLPKRLGRLTTTVAAAAAPVVAKPVFKGLKASAEAGEAANRATKLAKAGNPRLVRTPGAGSRVGQPIESDILAALNEIKSPTPIKVESPLTHPTGGEAITGPASQLDQLLSKMINDEVSSNAIKRGNPSDVPNNPIARRAEIDRLKADGRPVPEWLTKADEGGPGITEALSEDLTPASPVVAADEASPIPRTTVGDVDEPMTVGEQRRYYGAEEAGRRMEPRRSADAVRMMTDEPNISRIPLEAEEAGLDAQFRRLIEDERGSVSPKSMFDTLNQVRIMSMLSGLALPKSVLGNVNAIGTAAVENASTAPIREAFNIPANLASFKQGWKGNANPARISGSGGINVIGRTMGALDATTQSILERAGLTPDEAQRLLLTRPNMASDALGLNSPVGRAMFPFQRTPFNVFKEGFSAENVNTPRRAALTAGAAGVGAALDDEDSRNIPLLGLLSAAMGTRGVPFLLGAAFGGGGRRSLTGISPLPEYGVPAGVEDLIRMSGFEPAFSRAYLNDNNRRTQPRRTTRRERE